MAHSLGAVFAWLYGPAGGNERLREHLATKDTCGAKSPVLAAEDVDLDGFEVEQIEEIVEGGHRHEGVP
ncbi:MAG: hypothetical protein Rubg2KO_31220 [Rubricoccaceae bacterium]